MRKRVPRVVARAVATNCCWPMVRLESIAPAAILNPISSRIFWASRTISPCGVASATGWPSQYTSPPERTWTPVSSLISVDLPAPFSPTIAWISPFSKIRSTLFSAWVAPNRLSSPLSTRRGAAESTAPDILLPPSCRASSMSGRTGLRSFRRCDLLHLRVQELLRTGTVHVLLGNEVNPRVDSRRYLLALRCGQRGLDAQVAHVVRILDDQCHDVTVGQQFNEFIV